MNTIGVGLEQITEEMQREFAIDYIHRTACSLYLRQPAVQVLNTHHIFFNSTGEPLSLI